ncbi:MAG TPA: PLP-dependent transferase [Candidatus Dormibacteraeota bacterium]
MSERRRPATTTVHAGAAPDALTGALAPPLFATSTYQQDNPAGFEYGREGNPVWDRLESLLVELEQGNGALVMASGMAAIAAVAELVPVGGRVVGPANGYTGTRVLLRRLHTAGRISVDLVQIEDTAAVQAALAGAGLLCLETLTNPMLTVPDLAACIAAAHGAGALVMVDNTVATPLTVRPLDLGADLVVHSVSKYLGGHSDLIAGAVVVNDPGLLERLRFTRQHVGGILGPHEAWLALRGARTLAVRFERQQANAAELAGRLEAHPEVAAVSYPGLASHPHHARAAAQMAGGYGALLAVEVSGGADRAEAVAAATRVWLPATSLGGVESTLERRARYPVDAEVCPPGMLRLSCGIEDVEDLWEDLDAALAQTSGRA